ncbi:MAG: hypothetical protein IPN77_29970 [Sandaracinaceae bacterium]|nr:hypothetical protein [Sandaracinaceae bacterium]
MATPAAHPTRAQTTGTSSFFMGNLLDLLNVAANLAAAGASVPSIRGWR